MNPTRLLPLLVVILLPLAGCSTSLMPPTYINIPQQTGDVAFGNPNAKDVREITVLAVSKALAADPINGPYELLLPAGSTAETYALITHELGPDALVPSNVPAVALDEDGKPIKTEGADAAMAADPPMLLGDFPHLEVRAIRVRSANGEVDLVRPSTSGRRMSTVYLGWEAGFGWFADRVRPWRIDPDAQPQPVGPVNPTPLPEGAVDPGDGAASGSDLRRGEGLRAA